MPTTQGCRLTRDPPRRPIPALDSRQGAVAGWGMDLDTEVVDDPDAGTTCGCGRVRVTAHDFVRWCSAVSPDRPYGGSPSTWQNVRLGRCRPPNEAHLDPAYPAWALALCWTPGVARARANTTPGHIETGRRNRARWDRWRAAQGR